MSPECSLSALQSVQVCEREAWLGRAGAALSGQERVEFLKVVTDDEPDDQLDKRFFKIILMLIFTHKINTNDRFNHMHVLLTAGGIGGVEP